MRKLIHFFFLFPFAAVAQADNEIQVYASPTIQKNWTIFELHSNYTVRGSQYVSHSTGWLNETLEVTHGFAKNFELGFYTFTTIAHDGRWMYQGNQLRPRVTFRESTKGKLTIGTSLSLEFGFYRPTDTTEFEWQGELRPIIDLKSGKWYIAVNPNIDFAVSGDDRGLDFSPQMKFIYTIGEKLGIGFESYFSRSELVFYNQQFEILAGPAIDLYMHPMWEVNAAYLFGNSIGNRQVFKLLLGRRRGK